MKECVPARVQVKRSSSGLGLFARVPIAKGAFVIEYVGEELTREEANKRGGKYLFETSSRRVIDGKGRANVARYINHACRPNCEVEIKKGRVLIFAKRAIKKGEEINYDYGKEYFEAYIKPHGCVCLSCTKRAVA